MPWTIITDAIVAGLLIATLIYVRRLSLRLDTIRAGRAEFEKLIADLTSGTAQASGHLQQIKAAADSAMQELQARIDRVQSLSGEFGRQGEDLKLLTERAGTAADRLDASVGRARFLAAAAPAAMAPQSSAQSAPLSAVQPAAQRSNPLERLIDDDGDLPAAKLGALSGLR